VRFSVHIIQLRNKNVIFLFFVVGIYGVCQINDLYYVYIFIHTKYIIVLYIMQYNKNSQNAFQYSFATLAFRNYSLTSAKLEILLIYFLLKFLAQIFSFQTKSYI